MSARAWGQCSGLGLAFVGDACSCVQIEAHVHLGWAQVEGLAHEEALARCPQHSNLVASLVLELQSHFDILQDTNHLSAYCISQPVYLACPAS